MNILWTDNALQDLDQIEDYISQDNASAAVRMLKSLRDAIGHLAKFPEMGRTGKMGGTRELVVRPYIIQYKIDKDRVVILALVHGARKWPD